MAVILTASICHHNCELVGTIIRGTGMIANVITTITMIDS
jgi:hypothetical protein